MSLYLSSKDFALHEYIRKAKQGGNLRNLTPDELKLYIELREAKKAENLCMTELIFTKNVIRRLNIQDLYWVCNNFERITHSLFKQRDLIKAVSASLMRRKPEPEEKAAIVGLIKDIRKRIDYLNSIPIPENIRLTPIQDYLDLTGGKSFADEVKTEFAGAKDLFESRENGKMDEYITEMIDTLEKAGKAEAYKERLAVYTKRAKEKIEKAKAEKEAEKKAVALNESINGIDLFREQFFKGIRTLQGSSRINLSATAVNSQLKRGNRGKFCILCCKFTQGKIRFRYMLANGNESPSFQNVGLYDNLEEAAKAMRNFQKAYPDRAFEAVCI